ncbi:hypothetical protein MMC29_002460 [Sticta canariensis]|nr:hypothetical protein [Sticta canariensis]
MMISTTLMTFLFQAPASTITVELVGSWDRFTKSYPLKRDQRTGPGHWRGCHTFTNITCDGDSLDVSSSRDGGLKMGGTYWYFYRLDGDAEHFNPVEPSTNRCPFLPGQHVNILEVPVQAIDPLRRYGSSDSVGSDVYTLDPGAKYISPKPLARRTPRYSSITDVDSASAVILPDEALQSNSTALNRESRSSTLYQPNANSSSPGLSIGKPQSSGSATKRMLFAAFCKMRPTRSAGFAVRSESKGERQDNRERPVSEGNHAKTAKLAPSFTANISIPDTTQNMMPCISDQRNGEPVLKVIDGLPLNEQFSSLCLGPPDDEASLSVTARKTSRISNVSCYFTSLEPLQEDNAAFEESSTNSQCRSSVSATTESKSFLKIPPMDAVVAQVTQGVHDESRLPYDEVDCGAHSFSGSDSSSYSTNNLFSPGLAPGSVYTDAMSPYHLSQPDTPSISEFGGDLLETGTDSNFEPHATLFDVDGPKNIRIGSSGNLHDTEYPELDGFQGYSLSETEQASVLTLRKSSSATLESHGGGSPFGKQGSRDLVHSWNDGSEHRLTALEELFDDLGYLGEMIV